MSRMRFRLTAVLSALAVLGLLFTPAATSAPPEPETVTGAVGEAIGDTGATLDDVTIDGVRYDRTSGAMLADGTATYTTAAGDVVTQDFKKVPLAISASEAVATQTGASCDVLNLDLGPIFLDLLGLQVDLSEVNLDITAVPGPGNLLGNLLCAVAGLLDPGSSLGNLVDQLLAGLGRLLDQLLGAIGGLSLPTGGGTTV